MQKKKILVVEENEALLDNISEILQLADYDVVAARSGRDGVSKTMSIHPDLILCDIDMPRLSGYRMLEVIRKSNHTQTIPVIILTDGAERKDIRKGMQSGADDYIIKPFNTVDLLDAIAARIQKSKHSSSEFLSDQSLYDESKGLAVLTQLESGQEVRMYAAKEAIFNIGDTPRFFYVLKEGRTKTFRLNEMGKEFVTEIFYPGDFFGYESLIFDDEHYDGAIALEQSEICRIPKDLFLTALLENRHFSMMIMKKLAQTIEESEFRMLSIAYDSVRKRIANALLHLCEHSKSEDATIKVLREDLSNLVGTAKESVSRTLSEFKNEKLIKIERGNITILHKERLANIPG